MTVLRFQSTLAKRHRVLPAAPPSRVARMLALAHLIERLVAERWVASYSEVARRLGITDARMVQVCDLVLLAPSIQEALLSGQVRIDPKRAQRITREPSWAAQEARLAAIEGGVG
jgi:hypothetical protein